MNVEDEINNETINILNTLIAKILKYSFVKELKEEEKECIIMD